MILVAQWIGDDVVLRQNTTFGIARVDKLHDRPVICNGAEIGAGAVILGAVKIGEGAVVGANAVVRHDVDPYMIVGGVPAKVIGSIDGRNAATGHSSMRDGMRLANEPSGPNPTKPLSKTANPRRQAFPDKRSDLNA
ncbi:serine O-acetyltransferase [Paracoccus aestuariivivens]